MKSAGIDANRIAAVGVTGMVPAVVLIDKDGTLLRPSMQQNDARAMREIEEMQARFDGKRFFQLTGGSINQQVVAPKLRWVERHEPDVFKQIATVFGSYDYIAYRLTGARSIEHNWALESGLMDFAGRNFAPELVAEAGISPSVLPAIHRSQDIIGAVTEAAAQATGLKAGTPVVRRLRRPCGVRLCGRCREGRRPGAEIRRRGRHSALDRKAGDRSPAVHRLPHPARPLFQQWLHRGERQPAELDRARARERRG